MPLRDVAATSGVVCLSWSAFLNKVFSIFSLALPADALAEEDALAVL